VAHAFGHFTPDPNVCRRIQPLLFSFQTLTSLVQQYENLYHMQGWDQFKSVAFDFEFTTPAGFARFQSLSKIEDQII